MQKIISSPPSRNKVTSNHNFFASHTTLSLSLSSLFSLCVSLQNQNKLRRNRNKKRKKHTNLTQNCNPSMPCFTPHHSLLLLLLSIFFFSLSVTAARTSSFHSLRIQGIFSPFFSLFMTYLQSFDIHEMGMFFFRFCYLGIVFSSDGIEGGGEGEHYHEVLPWKTSRSMAEEEATSNTSLILAQRRTTRKDPLDNYNHYTGGWNISNRHYIAVSSYLTFDNHSSLFFFFFFLFFYNKNPTSNVKLVICLVSFGCR